MRQDLSPYPVNGRMFGNPWIILSRKPHAALRIASDVYHSADLVPASYAAAYPSIISLLGKTHKSEVLRNILGGPDSNYPQERHGQIHLWLEPHSSRSNPLLFADCEINHYNASHWHNSLSSGPAAYTPIKWAPPGRVASGDLGASICSRVLLPMSNIVCIFASDFGGISGTARFIAKLIQDFYNHDLSGLFKPRLLVVASSQSTRLTEAELESRMISIIRDQLCDGEDKDAESLIYGVFHSLRTLILLPALHNSKERAQFVRERLLIMDGDATESRISNRVLFSFSHIQSLCSSLITHFCEEEDTAFSFIGRSRPHGFSLAMLNEHLNSLLAMIPCEAWLWHFVIPLLASSLLLATYPPESHYFPPSLAFQSLYLKPATLAIQEYSPYISTHTKFVNDLEAAFCLLFARLVQGDDVKQLHLRRLQELRPYFLELQSNTTCFSCLLYTPEKVLDCGHTLCDNCIKIFGIKSLIDRNEYSVSRCVLCDRVHESRVFRFIPPTAGIRILSLDGGGIRGIITLTVLLHLEKELSYLGCPLRDCFDSVVGTSSGGLAGIGIFLMRWTPKMCLEKFHTLIHETFGSRQNLPAFLEHVQTLLLICLDKCKYNSLGIKAAFQSTLGPPPKMFNPLGTDTKVAVITAPTKGNRTAVLCNYNGGKRQDGSETGYQLIRATQAEYDVTVDEAALCTTAAPGFFGPVALRHGKHQDGALHYNNPAKIAIWEYRALWPDKSAQPDLVLSIGTGWAAERVSLSRPRSPGLLARILEAWEWNLSGKRQWEETKNFIAPQHQHRFHRIDLQLETKEPRIDDASTVDSLKLKTEAMLAAENPLCNIHHNWLASLFYVEIGDVAEDENSFQCSATILCRQYIPRDGLRALYNKLFTSGAYFLVNGRPVLSVKSEPRNTPPYRCLVKFLVRDLNEKLYISLGFRCLETRWDISGLPRKVSELIAVQGLNGRFGRSDHRVTHKTMIAQKRSTSSR